MQLERHSGRAGAALRALAEDDPAIAALSLWCAHRDGQVTQTAAETISYGPDFEGLPAHEQRGLAAHHILHVAFRHSARQSELHQRLGDGFDAALYNLAADALVNEALLLADHALPRPAVTVTGLLDQAIGQVVTPQEALAEWDADRLYFALMGRDGKDGAREKARSFAQAQAFEADVAEAPGEADPSGDAAKAARWQQHMIRAMDAGRQAGRGIGRLGHMLADVAAPRVPWEVLLRRLLTRSLMMAPVPNPCRPARRWIAGTAEAMHKGTREPGFQPGRRPSTDVPRIVVGLDASSSIDDARLALFWGEVTGIARRMAAVLELIVFDDEIRRRQQLDPAQTRLDLPELPRGGGTAFVPVIAEAARLEASALVMLTDLEGDAGPAPRGFEVIWVVPDPAALEAPFGKLVDMTA